MRRIAGFLILALAFLITNSAYAAFDSAALPTGGELTIQRITPDGENVPAGHQITIEFNRPVVAIGKMDRSSDDIPITITPSLVCQWRWITTRTLACILDEKQAMQSSTAYTLQINPGIKTLDGVTLSQPVEHKFITQRPESSDVQFRVWTSPTHPVMRVIWNQPVTSASVLQHLYLLDNDKKRIAVAVSADTNKRILPKWLHVPGEKIIVSTGEAEEGSDDANTPKGQGSSVQGAQHAWIIEPAQDLPLNQTVEVHVEPGIVSPLGPMPSIEDSSIKEFDTFPAFNFIGLRCSNNANEVLHVAPGEKQKPENLCNPLAPIALEFSSPVSRREVRDRVAFEPSLGNNKNDNSFWGDLSEENDSVTSPHGQDRTYSVYLPRGLKAAQTYTMTIGGRSYGLWGWLKHIWLILTGQPNPGTGGLQDKFGRWLPQPATVTFSTDHRLPNLLLEYSAAVLEKSIDSDVPVYVNNIDHINWSYNRLNMNGAAKNLRHSVAVPHVPDVQFLMPVGMRDMLDGQSGAFWGSFATDPETRRTHADMMNKTPLFAEVTPFQVHVKLGHFNSLVWVTDLATGQPVGNAGVTLYQDILTNMNGPQHGDAVVHTDADGLAILPGTEQVDPDLSISRAWNYDKPRFFVRVSKDKDMALLPIWNQFEIDNYRSSGTSFYPRNEKKFGHMVTWGATAEGIYHPGDTVQYKFYVRNQDNRTLTPPPLSGYWLEIMDPTGKVVHTVKNIALSKFGSASGEFTVGKKATVGWYNFRLKANFNKNTPNTATAACDNTQTDDDDAADGDAPDSCGSPAEYTWTPLRVLISDFTPVPFQVRNQLNGDLFHTGDTVTVDSDAKLHSGGPYTQAQARITAILTPGRFVSKKPAASGFFFGTELPATEPQQVYETTGPLDNKGEHKTSFAIDEKKIYYGRLMVESAVQDDRGKYVAHQSYADYVGVDRFAGLRLPQWFYTTKDDIAPDYIVVDERGEPVKNVAVSLTLERKEQTAARVKSAGNSYLPETETTLIKESECHGTSDSFPATCPMKARHAGDYTLRATITDTHGRTQETTTQLWVSGPDYVLWDNGSDAALDIIPDKDSYHIGDTAHFLIKNPYPGAKALVTVERYGVLDHFVMTLADSAAVIDLPVKPDYMPGFYLSVNIMSPRVDKPLAAGQVDLGKPTFRMGYVKVPVKDAYKEIEVTAKADRDMYRPGDKVHVTLNAHARFPDHKPVELAIAVLDDSVFDLIAGGKNYYDPYAGFYNLESLDLRNYSLLTRLIGRQKFEKKGANPGGDGGSSLNMRSIFKYVSYWNPSLPTDAAGNAAIDFIVPDNLTGWHILVMATTPGDRFGLGEGDFKVNRPTEVRPEMPNQLTEGDQFEARFSVMNRTKQDRTLTVSIKAEGDINTANMPDHIEKTIIVKAYERALVTMPVKAGKVDEKREQDAGQIRFTVRAGDASDTDAMTHQVPIRKMRSLDVTANYGTTLADKIEEPIAFPDNIYPDVGAVSVSVAPTVIGNLEGAFQYMRDYPYPCWEQVLTRGVMAAHFKNLHGYISDKITWPGSDTLPDQTLTLAADYQAPNGGMSYFIADDNHTDPYLSAYTALAFNWLRHDGYTVPDAVERKLHQYLLNFLRNNQAPTFYSPGMSSTVRAVALAALAENKEIDRNDIERYAPFVKDMSLFGKAHFAKAASLVPGEENQAVASAKMILAHANETGGKFIFSEELDDSYSRILSSPLRENCAILDVFAALGETSYGKDLVGDIPFKLVRTITQTRGGHDHWENTQENMFCMNALIAYSRLYEKDAPAMKVTAAMDQKTFGTTQFKDFRDPLVSFERPLAAGDVGRQTKMELTREGTGRLYYATRLSYAPRQSTEDGTNAGIEIHREYSMQHDGKWSLLSKPYAIHQGDVVRVDLYVSLPAARNFVVVDDPIPGGFEPINTDIANTSKVDAAKGVYQAAGGSLWFKYNDWNDYNFSFWSFNHQELLHNAARFYADYLPAGNYHLSYAAQAIGAGEFAIMPTLAAEMYDPDVYGKTGFDHLTVSSNLPPAP